MAINLLRGNLEASIMQVVTSLRGAASVKENIYDAPLVSVGKGNVQQGMYPLYNSDVFCIFLYLLHANVLM